jgi:crotonobetainyl-CoA:carnitine CoA-transferase CaiB-like acyl-CoA transferase
VQGWLRLYLDRSALPEDCRYVEQSRLVEKSFNADRKYMEEFNTFKLMDEERTMKEWMIYRSSTLPCSPVRSVKDVVNDEQLAFRDYWVELDHPQPENSNIRCSYKLSGTPWKIEHAAPLLGGITKKSANAGLQQEDLVKMRQAGVI